MAHHQSAAEKAFQAASLPHDSDDLHRTKGAEQIRVLGSPQSTVDSETGFSGGEDDKLAVMAAACKTILEVRGRARQQQRVLRLLLLMGARRDTAAGA
jgi:hypothetical protein